MAKIAVLYCKKVKDHSCIACAKCYKGMAEKNGEYGRHDEIELVAMTDCGDCPGLVVPRVDLQKTVLDALGVDFDAIYFGTCVKKATALMNCPMNLEGITATLEDKFGVPVTLGTHDL